MPRLMSVSLTERQVRDRVKTVTRRTGWLLLRPGDQLTLCKKVMGRRPGEPLDRIVTVEVTAVRRERLDAITTADVTAEGFDMTPAEFVSFFCGTHKGCLPATVVTRIEWRYLEAPGTPGTSPAGGAGRPEAGTGAHPNEERVTRIRVSLHRPADGTGDILAAWEDGPEYLVGEVSRAEGGSPTRLGWKADLWAAHPSLADGHATWKRTARELGESLTSSVRAIGPWWL